MAKEWTVSEVAGLAHVTVRTLHYYDEIQLLVPSHRSGAGYRLYSEADLERLHQILIYRELGLALETISQVLDEPSGYRLTALQSHRGLLVEKRRRMDAVIRAIDRALEAMIGERKMNTHEMFEGFEDLSQAPETVRAHHATYAEEAHDRWGDTDAYPGSLRRAGGYSTVDWKLIQKEMAQHEAGMASLMGAGEDPEGAEAMASAEAMRLHISRWYYPCNHELHAGLADMYEADPRFKAHYENRAEGLADFVARAIRANALRAWEEGAK